MERGFSPDTIKRIIVRVPNWVGDAVMCTPALLVLRDQYPTASITILARPAVADLLESLPAVDDVLVYEHKGRHAGLGGKFELIRQLRKNQYDLAVLLQNAMEAALLMWLAAVPCRMGYPTDGRRLLLNRVIPLPTNAHTLHQVDYFKRLMTTPDGHSKQYTPTLKVHPGVDAEIKELLAGLGVGERDLVLGLNPGSMYGGAKRWIPERFAETADRFIENWCDQNWENHAIHCLIVGAPGEENLGAAISAKMRHTPVVLSGKTSLQALMAVIKRCQLFITNDTGPMHIANAFGVPIVAIFGPTNHQTTAPYLQPYAIARSQVDCSPCLLRECPIDHRCMTLVTVDDVLRSAEQLLVTRDIRQSSQLGQSAGWPGE